MNRLPLLLVVCTTVAVFAAAPRAFAEPFAMTGWSPVRSLDSPARTIVSAGSREPVRVLEIDSPGIRQPNHLVTGEIRYQKVGGMGYLEMWTIYPDGSRYFTRTLGDAGPMAKLAGDSDWTPVALPFFGKDGSFPARLEINAILPGGGEIEWRHLALHERPGEAAGAWWSDRDGARLGSLGGLVFGLLGAVGGVLAGLGIARRFVLTLLVAGILFRVIMLGIGASALASGQSYAVWYPAMLLGGLATLLSSMGFFVARRAYLQRELRMIAAAG